MKHILAGLLYGCIIAINLLWSQYFFGNKPANYFILLFIFLIAHLFFFFFDIKFRKSHLYISGLLLVGSAFFIYYSEIFHIRKEIAIYVIVITLAFIVNQLKPNYFHKLFLPGILLGVSGFLLPLQLTYMLTCFIFFLWVFHTFQLTVVDKIIFPIILLCGIIFMFRLPMFPVQGKIKEKVIGEVHENSDHLVVSSIKNNINFYLNRRRLYSTAEYAALTESAVVNHLNPQSSQKRNILILGGENGFILTGLLDFNNENRITCFSFRTAIQQQILKHLNASEILGEVDLHKLNNVSGIWKSLENKQYDLIIIDPLQYSNCAYAPLYSIEVMRKLYDHLSENGQLIVRAFNEDIYPLSNHLIYNTLTKIDAQVSTYHLPLNTGGLLRWFTVGHSTQNRPTGNNYSKWNWYRDNTYNWISKTGQQKNNPHNLVHTLEKENLQRLKRRDSVNTILNF